MRFFFIFSVPQWKNEHQNKFLWKRPNLFRQTYSRPSKEFMFFFPRFGNKKPSPKKPRQKTWTSKMGVSLNGVPPISHPKFWSFLEPGKPVGLLGSTWNYPPTRDSSHLFQVYFRFSDRESLKPWTVICDGQIWQPGARGVDLRYHHSWETPEDEASSQEPFMTFEFDGVLGLGLASLAVDPEFSWIFPEWWSGGW